MGPTSQRSSVTGSKPSGTPLLEKDHSGPSRQSSHVPSVRQLSPEYSPGDKEMIRQDQTSDSISEIQITLADIGVAIPLPIWATVAGGIVFFLVSPFIVGLAAIIAIDASALLGVLTFIAYRYQKLINGKSRAPLGWAQQAPDLDALPGVYWLYILGSGGHTTEMIQTVKASLHISPNMHRRYMVTTGDKHSQEAASRLELAVREQFGHQAGTSDVVKIQRARAVHQSFLSAVIPALWTVCETVGLLTRTSNLRPTTKYGSDFTYPSVIITNGPGTSFIVAAVAFTLKIFYVIPETKCKVIYIETWAHVTSLSLTGKLFDKSGIADLFCVQHQDLARKLGKFYLPVVSMLRPQPVD